ncbi:hypothetical protein D1007_07820 [Hordeum vulgare]|nr:hypothetical protein D1007_07820 [Hordeum vulgare]
MNQLSEFEFSMVFPSSKSLRMIASCTSFTLPFNQLVTYVKAATNGFKSAGQLFEVWVLVEGVPAELRSVPFLMAFGILLRKPIEVDDKSLVRLGLVRLKIWCVNPVCLHGPVDVFPSADGIRSRVRLEGAEAFQAPPPSPHPFPSSSEKRDDGSVGGWMNPSGGTGGGTDARFTRSEWDRLGPEVQDVIKQNAPKDDVQHVETVLASAVNEMSAPVGTLISGVCSNMPVRPLSPSKSGIEDMAASPARDVFAPVRKKNSTVRKFSAKSRAASGSKTSVAGLCHRLDADLGAASGSPSRAAPLSPSSPSPPIRTPTSMDCKGKRVRDSGESMSEHAERRAAARVLLPSGIALSPNTSPPPSPIRLVLPSLSDDHLLHVLEDVGVSINAGFGSPSAVLSIIRANETA